jgi:hypothetical protein
MRWIGSHRGGFGVAAARLGMAGFAASGALQALIRPPLPWESLPLPPATWS